MPTDRVLDAPLFTAVHVNRRCSLPPDVITGTLAQFGKFARTKYSVRVVPGEPDDLDAAAVGTLVPRRSVTVLGDSSR